MNTVHRETTITIRGKEAVQNFFQLIGWPLLPAKATPTTFADAPIGVAHPPISVPRANVQESVCRSIPCEIGRAHV